MYIELTRKQWHTLTNRLERQKAEYEKTIEDYRDEVESSFYAADRVKEATENLRQIEMELDALYKDQEGE